ncbi:outer membrane lipoprotein carrier protein LolA [Aestuariicoccus sp. MJ-SS9]|uniref:LolA family protein n=1 Tax=Aestuariicoccus sp. MJ-SS9 TaxID=3079855 RepID=UPI0029062351|nr:outer membrane lipoprotein carrier protein LolA [Aestuariicoccus sp. MJ-SS9]MDU8912724.1 outer membrane lipoprotein carrier protein LolA [Aestuariicoccus sp. MJ-SS9]
MFRILTAAAFLVTLALPAAAEKLSLNEVSRYLNGIQSAEGKITQINSDGTLSTGTLYIKRPGKMRFDYDPPERALVLVGAGAVHILDRKLGAVPDTYPLNQTPLSIILARNVDLARAGMVTAHDYDGTSTIVTARDPERPEYGTIQLKFTGDPVELRQWVITDGDGQQTTVVLGALDRATLSNRLFDIRAEVEKLRR